MLVFTASFRIPACVPSHLILHYPNHFAIISPLYRHMSAFAQYSIGKGL